VDALLQAAAHETQTSPSTTERLMDHGELEMERGITITSKVTRLDYINNQTLNIVDTPGHADFAGEVDRILGMVDGVCLMVDAREGPMAQTKYVLSRALKMNLNPICILNKCDMPDALSRLESGEVENELFDLFVSLGADDEQMEYPTFYASAKAKWATQCLDTALGIARDCREDFVEENKMSSILDSIIDYIPAPVVIEDHESRTFAMAAATVGYDKFLGRMCTGRIFSGSVRINDSLKVVARDGSINENSNNVVEIFVNRGVDRVPLSSTSDGSDAVAKAGDIVTLASVPDTIQVGDTLTSSENPINQPLDTPPLNPPTLSVDFGANNGPLAGKEGSIVTASRIRSRLFDETDNNVTLTVSKSESDSDKTVVFGRGELQIGILVEQMRREGYEFIVSPPRIMTFICKETGDKLEPFEEVTIDVDSVYSGTCVNALTGNRKGVLMSMTDSDDGKSRLVFEMPSRGLLGFGSEIATLTKGSAIVNHCFVENRKYAGLLGDGLDKGKLVSNDSGKATLYALSSIAERGTLFVAPGDIVYPGMVIGESSRPGDLEVNPVRAKATSNVRTVNKDAKLFIPPPRFFSVEEYIGYMSEDEIIEVTPLSVRLRKAELDSGARARAARSRKKQLDAAKRKKA